ncbi:MAG TPA: LysM domain-containing protein [Candidatus Limnocylindria bacterium]|nr:LysM domain-containing protein [Candidatus Limnocylindria bacterium]
MDRVCPLLALGADRRTAVDGVDPGHRCFAVDPPGTLERDRQSRLCLNTSHTRCERYLAFVGRGALAVPGSGAIGDGFRSTRLVIAPEPAWRGMAGRARRSRSGLAAAGLVLGACVAGTAIVAGSLAATGATGAASATSTPTTTPVVTPRSTPRPTANPTPSPSEMPVESATPQPTPPPTPSPPPATPVPTQRTYVVQEGDTLAAIAQQFGVSVAALQAANDIEDPNEIIIGDVLVIP